MELPIYNVPLEDYDAGLFAISLVNNPAIESNFVYMSKQEPQVWRLSNEERGEAIGALIIPDKPIYRKVNGTEFNLVFSKEVIAQISERMQQTGFNKYFTIEHEMDARDSVQFLESWIKEADQDKSVAFGIDEPVGTLFAKVKINSEFIKDNIKDGKLNGFSIELDASLVKEKLSKQINNKTEKQMDFKEVYKNYVSVDGKELLFNDEKIENGTVLFEVITETGEDEKEIQKIVPFTGEFSIDNINYNSKNGLVISVEDVELSLTEKIDSLNDKLKEIETKLSEIRRDENDELVESVKAISTKLEEQSLLAEQKEAEKKLKNIENKTVEFSADAYKVASGWINRFRDNK